MSLISAAHKLRGGTRLSERDGLNLALVSLGLSVSAPKGRLRKLKLNTSQQREALAAMKVSSGNREFERLVLAHLALIRDVRNQPRPKNKKSQKPYVQLIPAPDGTLYASATIVQKLRGLSSLVRKMARRLEKDCIDLKEHGLFVRPPAQELRLYADELTREANRYTVRAQRPRHSTHRDTGPITDLIGFVQHATSKRHWNELAILLREACNDHGVTPDRLRKLYDYWKRKGQTLPLGHPRGRSVLPQLEMEKAFVR